MFVFRYVNLVLAIVNIALFVLWWSLIRVDAMPSGAVSEYYLSHFSLQITILGAVIGIAALVLAAMAFIGFQTVLERAELKADLTAREVVSKLAEKGDLIDKNGFPRQSANLPDVGEAKKAVD